MKEVRLIRPVVDSGHLLQNHPLLAHSDHQRHHRPDRLDHQDHTHQNDKITSTSLHHQRSSDRRPSLHLSEAPTDDEESAPPKFNPDHLQYRFLCNRLHVRYGAIGVASLETTWIAYQFVKILVCYIRNPNGYTEIFLPSFMVCLFSSLAVGLLISGIAAQRSTRLIPYILLNILCIGSSIGCVLVSVVKSSFSSTHPKLASMASSIVPAFEVIFYANDGITDVSIRRDTVTHNSDVHGSHHWSHSVTGRQKSIGDESGPEEETHNIMVLIIVLSLITVLVKSVFLNVVLRYYRFARDLEASQAPSTVLTAVFAIR